MTERINIGLAEHPPGGRPLLIAVLHDGLPNRRLPFDPFAVDNAIISFSQKLASRNQVRLTFLQMGDTYDGRDFCINLDDNLVNEGAKLDVVDTKTFAQLKKEGLVQAIIDALLESLDEKVAVRPNQQGTRRHGALKTTVASAQDRAVSTKAQTQMDADIAKAREIRKHRERRLLGP